MWDSTAAGLCQFHVQSVIKPSYHIAECQTPMMPRNSLNLIILA